MWGQKSNNQGWQFVTEHISIPPQDTCFRTTVHGLLSRPQKTGLEASLGKALINRRIAALSVLVSAAMRLFN